MPRFPQRPWHTQKTQAFTQLCLTLVTCWTCSRLQSDSIGPNHHGPEELRGKQYAVKSAAC
ncbi:hypothetical protein FKM82_014316 [Ascaphus truei]